jgi:hypothetical protein
MSQVAIRKALEKRLAAMPAALSTAYENVTFNPVAGTPYQRANLLPNTPDNAVQGGKMYFDRGIFQVTLCYPMGAGPNAAESKAQAVRDWFWRGTSLVEGSVTVHVTNTPRISPALIDGDRFCIPVSVSYQAQINLT